MREIEHDSQGTHRLGVEGCGAENRCGGGGELGHLVGGGRGGDVVVECEGVCDGLARVDTQRVDPAHIVHKPHGLSTLCLRSHRSHGQQRVGD